MDKGISRMSPRSKAFLQLGGAIAAGAILIGGSSYALNSSKRINEFLMERNPKLYMNIVADYIEENPEEALNYSSDIGELARSVNSSSALGEEDRLYLMESNASLLQPEKAIGVCESQVVNRLDSEGRLEYVLSSIDSTESMYYPKIVGEILRNVGEEAYNSIADVFRK